MSKNVRTYVLLGLVLVIWGIIGFRILGVFSPEEEPPTFVENLNFEPKKGIKKDTFSIKADYRDPFLGTLSASVKTTKIPKKTKPSVQFPDILYTGLVTDQQTKNNIFFVTIAGNQYLMQKGNEQNGVTLLRGNGKSIRIRYKGILKTIPLQ